MFDPGEVFDDDDQSCEIPDDDSLIEGMALGAGVGWGIASDEFEERKVAEDILKRRDSLDFEENDDGEPEKISLRNRQAGKNKWKISAAQRWMADVAAGHKRPTDPVEYTEGEQREILDYEGEHDFEC